MASATKRCVRRTSLHALEQRVAGVIHAYDAQGNHRTGTDADEASAEWLADAMRQLSAEPSLEAFTLSRVGPQSCYLRIADRRIEGVPVFDAGFTDAEGVRCRLGRDRENKVVIMIVHDLNPRALSTRVIGFVQARSWYQNLTPIVVTSPPN